MRRQNAKLDAMKGVRFHDLRGKRHGVILLKRLPSLTGDRSRTPLETVRAFLAYMEAKPVGEAIGLINPECEYTNIPMGIVRGPKENLVQLEPFFASIEENELIILRSAADVQVVCIERLDRHRSARGCWEPPVTGIFEVHEGLITVWGNTSILRRPAAA